VIRAILLAGGGPSMLSAANRAALDTVEAPVTVHVFTTPTCPHCPRAVNIAHEMAFANPQITAYAVEVTEFPDLARRYRVTGVPKTVVVHGAGEATEILGALPEDDFIAQALSHGQPGG
jgi:thiol-disulfide isomerase/thioredoxin